MFSAMAYTDMCSIHEFFHGCFPKGHSVVDNR